MIFFLIILMIKGQKTFSVEAKAAEGLYTWEKASQDILTWVQHFKIRSFDLFA